MTATTLVATNEHDQDVYRCELRHLDADNIDRQWFLNGVPVSGAPAALQTRRAGSGSSGPLSRHDVESTLAAVSLSGEHRDVDHRIIGTTRCVTSCRVNTFGGPRYARMSAARKPEKP